VEIIINLRLVPSFESFSQDTFSANYVGAVVREKVSGLTKRRIAFNSASVDKSTANSKHTARVVIHVKREPAVVLYIARLLANQ